MVDHCNLVPWDVLDVEIGDLNSGTSEMMVLMMLDQSDSEAMWGC